MNGIAVPHVNVKSLVVSLAGAAILLFALVGTAGAASPIGKDGKIHACYRVKGKPKGNLRIVPQSRKRCRRGERKVAWSASGMTGVPGVNGTAGNTSGGQTGTNGSNGVDSSDGSNEAALKTQVASLNVKVDGLEKVLGDVTNGQLTEAVDSLGLVDDLCTQNEELANQIDLIAGVVEGLGLNEALDLLGGLLEIPELPEPLGTLGCGTP